MSSRSDKLEQLHKSLKKHFKYVEDRTERNVLETLLYACCLEDTKAELADEAFAKLQQTYFDWNEVRVTTVIELSEVLSNLPNPAAAGGRVRRSLQSLYESRYQYDIDDLKKANLSKATEEIQAWQGVTPFVSHYVSQQALGGHSIPVDGSILNAMMGLEILTAAEAEKKSIPGVERAIPKNKGSEFGNLLHQFAVELASNPKNSAVVAVFKDFGLTPKVPAVVEQAPPKKKTAPPAAPAGMPPAKVASPKTAKVEPEPKAAPAKGAAKSAAPVKADPPKSVKGTKEEPKVESKPATKAKDATKDTKSKPDTSKGTAKGATTSKATDKTAKGDSAAKSTPKSSSGKPKAEPAKLKASEKPSKGDAKKQTAAPKKPAKMANNVKITKKKPK